MSNYQTDEPLLIFRLGSVGDTVVALPCFHLIKKAFPGRALHVLTNVPVNRKACALELILGDMGLADHFIEYPSKSSFFKKVNSIRKIIRDNKFRKMIYFHQTRHWLQAWRDFLFFKLCGIQTIIGLSLFESGFHYRFDKKTHLYESEYKRLARQLKKLGVINWNDPSLIDLKLTEVELHQARTELDNADIKKPFIACSVGTKLALKDWGQDNWKKLIALLGKRYPHFSLVFIGAQEEAERSDALLQLWTGNTLNLCGKVSVRVSAAVLKDAALFVGHDSGPMHLASAVNTPCVAVFSRHAKPGCWYPLGSQHKVLYPKDKSIFSIRADEVMCAIQSISLEEN